MGIFSRISALIESNLNALLDRAEDPEKILDQSLRDMNDALREAKIAVARTVKDKKLLEQKYTEAREDATKWEEKATFALTKGDENLAREALKKKKLAAEKSQGMADQLQSAEKQTEMLKSSLIALENKIEQARSKKDVLLAKQKRAEADLKIHEQAARITDNSAFDAFDRMEKKVNDTEATAEAAKEMAQIDGNSNLDAKFAALEMDHDVEDELAALRKKIAYDKDPPKAEGEAKA